MAQTISVGARRKSNLDKVILSTRFLVIVALTVSMALAYIHVKVKATQLGYDISVNSQKKDQLFKENLFLEAEFMKLRSPERIEYLARELGFRFPTQEDVIYVKGSTIVGESR
jgi:cell division protein FtsL